MKNEKAPVRFGVVFMLLAGLVLSACGGPSTVFVTSWRSPKAEPLSLRGEPVVAVVMMQNDITRRSAEDALAREISHYGGKGIPMYTIFPGQAEGDEAAARKAIEGAGVKGIVVMRPKGKRSKTETHQSSYYDPMYSGYWGGYYGYGWGQPWSYARDGVPTGPMPYYGGISTGSTGTTTTTTTTEVVVVEVLVYSLKQNMLLWAGESESTPPEKVDEFVAQLAAETAKELGDKGLRASK
jgi:hypothetical protein